MIDVAREALTRWPVPYCQPRLIADRENLVFEVAGPDEHPAVLRLHRPGYQTAQSIRSELELMQALAAQGLPVPLPFRSHADHLLETIGAKKQCASLLSWIDGEPLGSGEKPLRWSIERQVALHRQIGRAVGDMHNAIDRAPLPDKFTRLAWDVDGFLGDDPLWGRFWDNPDLRDGERAVVVAAREAAAIELRKFRDTGADFGLIHADLLRENIFVSDTSVSLIDFDDCGYGFRLYDLATVLVQSWYEPEIARLTQGLIAGYRGVRALSDSDVALLPMFVMLRRFASMGWIISRLEPGEGSTRSRHYVERAVAAAREFISDD